MNPVRDGMQFHTVESRATGLIGYLLSDPLEGVSVVIDPPGAETELLLALLAERGLRLSHVLRTHVHAADGDDCRALCLRTGAVLAAGRGAVPGTAPGATGRLATRELEHGGAVAFGSEVVRVLSTPGHTPACVSYLWRDRLFCGDVFDLGGCATGGNEADPALLFDSISRRIFDLSLETLVFPAHPFRGRRVSTLAELRNRCRPMLTHGREAFITDMAFRRLVRPTLGRIFPPSSR